MILKIHTPHNISSKDKDRLIQSIASETDLSVTDIQIRHGSDCPGSRCNNYHEACHRCKRGKGDYLSL